MRGPQETPARSLGQEGPLEKGMATLSSILAWKIPGSEELGGLECKGRKESDTTEGTQQPRMMEDLLVAMF